MFSCSVLKMKLLGLVTVSVVLAMVVSAPAAEGDCKEMRGTKNTYNGKTLLFDIILHGRARIKT